MTLEEQRAEQFPEDLSATTTPEERIAMMWQLAVNAWTMRGQTHELELPRHALYARRREC